MKILEGLTFYLMFGASAVITTVIKGIFALRPNWRELPNIKLTVIIISTSVITYLYTAMISKYYEYDIYNIALAVIIIWFTAIAFYFFLSKFFWDWAIEVGKGFIQKFTLK